MKHTYKKNLTTVLQGIVMGIVEVIPGVSASTLALTMGIYRDFIDFLHDISDVMKTFFKFITLSKDFSDLKKSILAINRVFGGFLVLGMLIGIGGFAHVMSYLLENHPIYTFAFFFGLIVASIRVPLSQVKEKDLTFWGLFALTSLVFFLILGMKPAEIYGEPSLLLLFVAGFFAVCAMVLPGISGSFVLLLFGLYDHVIHLIKNITKLNFTTHDLLSAFVLGLGILSGFAIFVRFIKLALKKFPSHLMAFLAGLMVASLRVLWPFVKVIDGVNVKVAPWETPLELVTPIIFIGLLAYALTALLNDRMTKRKITV